MLAVKNILPDGQEDIAEFVRVSLGKELKPDAQSSNDMWDVVFGVKDNGDVVPFHFGIVYVTNDKGSTIATYILNYPKQCTCTCECTCDSK